MIEDTILSGLRNRDEVHAELFGTLGQVMHDALAIAFLVVVPAPCPCILGPW